MKKTPVYPSKTTINLAIREKSDFRLGRLLPRLLVLVIVVALFTKFAVMDRISLVADRRAALDVVQDQVSALELATADYDEVSAQYARYSSGWMNEEETALVDRQDALSLVEELLMPNATVLQVSISENVVAANLSGITLGEASALVRLLTADPKVSNVEVFTASNQEQPAEQVILSMVISMQTAEGGQQG